jgi:ribose transport system ATP-binding protein
MLDMSIAENLSLAALSKLSDGPVINRAREKAAIDAMIDKLRIKIGDPTDAAATLSGGNQQKMVIAKWLMTAPGIILLNDPTRGIDVGTKQELYQLLRDLADAGAAIVFYSTDYDELIGCCDRVLILYDGAVARELAGDEINETNIIASALNLDVTAEPARP